MNAMHHLLSVLERCSLPAVLATIVQVDGSSYQKAGTSALFMKDGTQIGVLRAGCVDTDLTARVPEILARGMSQCVVYDLRTEDDLSWGKGPGCNGTIHILVEPVHGMFRHDLLRAKSYLDSRCQVSLVRALSSEHVVSQYAFVIAAEHQFGTWRGEIPHFVHEWCLSVRPFLQAGSLRRINSDFPYIFSQSLWPKARLILFGAGPDARPLAAFAAKIGFAVTVCDWREAYASTDYFPDADAVHVGNPMSVVNQLGLGEMDAVVIMTHSFETDRALLTTLLQTPLLYLGILGQQTRTKRLLQGEKSPHWLYTPVGLAIGAQGPDEIAISILAELIDVIRTDHKGDVDVHE